MFQKLFTAHEKPKPVENSKADGIEHISSREHIAVLLKNMQDQHALLSVYTKDNRRGYISAVIQVSAQENYFLLDGIKPPADHQSLIDSGQFSVTARINGIKTRFAGNIESVGEDAGIPFYKVPFPAEIIQEQRREFFRAALPLHESIKVQMTVNDDTELEGDLRDLSVSGLCITIKTTSEQLLEKGIILPECSIRLADDETLSFSIEIRHLINRARDKITYIGARFVDLDRPTKRRIQHLVGQIDRKTRKNRLRTSP